MERGPKEGLANHPEVAIDITGRMSIAVLVGAQAEAGNSARQAEQQVLGVILVPDRSAASRAHPAVPTMSARSPALGWRGCW
jgi:hypothetical protein